MCLWYNDIIVFNTVIHKLLPPSRRGRRSDVAYLCPAAFLAESCAPVILTYLVSQCVALVADLISTGPH